MSRWPVKYVLGAGFALIVLANSAALFGVAYNRSGEPEAVVELNERELALPYVYGLTRENSGLALRLDWRSRSDEPDLNHPDLWISVNWLDKEKLAALGFDVQAPPDTPEARRRYGKMLPRPAFLVFEYDGPAYQAALRQRQKHLEEEQAILANNPGREEFVKRVESAQTQLRDEQQNASRLFVIDAGPEQEALRARYADRAQYFILPGEMSLRVDSRDNRHDLTGYLSRVSLDAINVPLQHRPVFSPIQENRRGQDRFPRYQARLAFGRRLEPWVMEVKGLAPAGH